MAKPENQKDMAAEKERILKYLREQLDLKLDMLANMEGPIQLENIKDVKELEVIIIKREIYDLRRHIQVIEMI